MAYSAYSRYYRYKLSDPLKKLYDVLLEGFEKRKKQVTFRGQHSLDEMSKVMHAVNYDNPHLFFADFREIKYVQSAVSCTFYLNYFLDDAEIIACNEQINAVVASLLGMVVGKSLKDAALLLHDWLVKNCTYGEEVGYFAAHSIAGAFINRTCVCEGFAKAYKHLADVIRMRCIVVTGEGIDPDGTRVGHGWNIIRPDSGFYHVDVTYDLFFAGNYCSRAYFLLSDREIMVDHSLDGNFEMPDCPNSGSLLPTVDGTAKLRAFLKSEYRRGAVCSEVRLTQGFTSERLMYMMKNSLTAGDIEWYNHVKNYWYGDYSRSLFICWK